MSARPLLEIDNLSTHYVSARGARVVRAVDEVSLRIDAGETPEQAARRETLEETGWQPARILPGKPAPLPPPRPMPHEVAPIPPHHVELERQQQVRTTGNQKAQEFHQNPPPRPAPRTPPPPQYFTS